MIHFPSFRCVLVVGLSLLLVIPAGLTRGDDLFWTNLFGDDSFDNFINWDPMIEPSGGDTVNWLAVGGNVNFNANEQCDAARVDNTVVWNLNGHEFQLYEVILGHSNPGHLTAMGGTVLTSHTRIGEQGSGALVINDAGWNISNELRCGINGQGELSLTNLGSLHSNGAMVGESGWATVAVEGQSTWTNANNDMFLGVQDGTAVVEVTGHSTVESSRQIFMAHDAHSTAHVTIDGAGSRMSGLGMSIAKEGNASAVVSDGGEITSAQHIVIAGMAGSTANVSIDGSSRMRADGEMAIAHDGTATVYIANGSEVSAGYEYDARDIRLAAQVNGQADVTVDGHGSALHASGNLFIAQQGSATLLVSNGGEVSAGTENDLHDIIMAGGSDSTADVTLDGRGSAMRSSGELTIGEQGCVTLTVSNGAEVTCGTQHESRNMYLARQSSSTATVTIEDTAASVNCTGDAYIGGEEWGSGGTATLSVNEGGTLNVDGLLKVWETGTLAVDGGSVRTQRLDVLNPTGLRINNSGSVNVIDGAEIAEYSSLVMDATSSFSAQHVLNDGLIRGSGRISANQIDNTPTGTIRVAGSDYLEIAAWDIANHGQINLIGGVIDFDAPVLNTHDGTISGRGGLIFNQDLMNDGVMNFGGDTDIYGRVVNGQEGAMDGDGEIVFSSGASGAFYDEVIHNGVKFKVSPNANVAFFGPVSGAGSFTGGGGVWFEGGYSPGNSPAWVQVGVDLTYGGASVNTMELAGYIANGPGATEYDVIEMIGGSELTLAGTLDIDLLTGFEPVFGSAFDIYRYGIGDRTGMFDTFNSPTWNNGLYFDISYSDTVVTLTVVPEPATILLLALSGLAVIRRR